MRRFLLPGGMIEPRIFEMGFDLPLEGFSARIVHTPYAKLFRNFSSTGDLFRDTFLIERRLEEEELLYLKRGEMVTFGVEPLVAYIWRRGVEVKNLRSIVMSKSGELPVSEITPVLRDVHA